MMAGRLTARALATALLTFGVLIVLAVGPVALAAAAPTLTIEQPLAGSITTNDLPLFSGSSEDEADAVTVKVYEGPSAEGLPIAILTTTFPPVEGKWEVATEAPLEPGVYTAVAEQELEGAVSAPVTFTIESVDTTTPTVSIEPVASPTSDATPTLTGGAGTEAGDGTVTVTIYEGLTTENEVVSGAATTEGSTWKYTPTELPDGTYTAQATQPDEAGHTGASTTVTFTVDTTAPAVSIDPVATPTKDATPTLTGGAGTEPGDGTVTVTIYEGLAAEGVIASTGIASTESSAWKYTPVQLPDGIYTAKAVQHDEAGNTAASVAVTFAVDATAPAPTITAPTEGAVLNTSRVTLSGTASQSSGDLHPITLKVYAGASTAGIPVQTLEVTASAGKWTTGASGPVLADHLYTVLAAQSDQAGNVGTDTVTFTIKTSSPVVTLDTGTFVHRASTLVTDATPNFSGTGSTAPEDSPTILVKIYKGGSTSGSPVREIESTLSGSKWQTGPVTALADGVYTAIAEQEDTNPFGQTGVSTSSTFTVDGHSPAVTLTTPANASTTTSSSQPLAGGAGTAAGDSATVTVQLYAGSSATGTPLQSVTVQATAGTWTTAAGGLTPGTYTARAEQSDDVGNIGLSASATFTVTTSPPTVTLATGTFVHRNGPLFSNATPSFSGTGSTRPEDSNTIHVKVYSGGSISGSPVREIEATLSGAKWQTSAVAALADGTYTAVAEQTTSNSSPPGSTSAVFTVDGKAPGVTLTTPANASTTTSSSQPLAGAAGTAADDSATVTVQLYAGSSATGTPLQAVSVQANSGAWSTAAGGLEPGTYTARAEQADDVGNIGLSVPATFTVTTPEPPSVTKTETTPVAPPVTPPVTTPVVPPAATEPALMQPFPVVRIAGSVSSFGVKLNLLTVQAPLGATVTVSCHGHGCPAKRVDTVSTSGRSGSKLGLVTITFRRFERSLRAGASLQIRISKAGQIGKYTRFTIRRGKLPKRLDTCLSPAGVQPIACPS
jgi:hypothetical protein